MAVNFGNVVLTEKNSPVWIAFYEGHYTNLTKLAKEPLADFSVLTTSTKKTIFHKSVPANADDRLEAITKGFLEGNCVNSSIKNTINKLWEGKTALYMAAESKYLYYMGTQEKIIKLFMSMGANPNIAHASSKGPLKPIDVIGPAYRPALEPDLKTCLLYGELEQALILLKKMQGDLENNNFFLTLRDDDKNNGLLLAILEGEKNGKTEELILDVIKALKECGDNLDHENARKETVLTLAVMKGYRKIITYLIRDTSATWSYKNCGTIVHLAAGGRAKNIDILELLVHSKPSYVTEINSLGRSPLHYVKCIETANYLIVKGADVKALDNMKLTPIAFVYAENQELSEWMSLYDPDLDVKIKAEIIKKRQWKERVEKKIEDLTPFNKSVSMVSSIILEASKGALADLLKAAVKGLF